MSLSTIFPPGPLALDAAALEALHDLLEAPHAAANARTLAEAAARSGTAAAGQPLGLQVVGNVAIIDVDGLLVQRRTWLSDLLGATVLAELETAIRDAAADSGVAAILLSFDSPGGAVHGTVEAAAAVREACRHKPVAAYGAGRMQSAAYWIASACDVVACSPAALVGSIGVVATHVDVSGAEQARGVKTTEVTAGRYKRIASAYAPLSAEGRATIQDQVDHIYAAFVEAVAEHRGVPALTVLDRMADGRTFVGRQAVEAGLADVVVSSIQPVLADLRTMIGAEK